MAQDSTTHATLLQRVAGRDPVAWREFVERYGGLIRGCARRHDLTPDQCDDVLQDVLMALSRAMPGFQYDPQLGKFRAYLKTIVLREVFRRFRQNRGEQRLGEDEPERESADEAGWEAEWRAYHLTRAMVTIRAEFREADLAAFDGYAIQGQDVQHVAKRLALSVDQVYQAKSRILKRLSAVVAEQIDEEG